MCLDKDIVEYKKRELIEKIEKLKPSDKTDIILARIENALRLKDD